jgi:hypothetical protein
MCSCLHLLVCIDDIGGGQGEGEGGGGRGEEKERRERGRYRFWQRRRRALSMAHGKLVAHKTCPSLGFRVYSLGFTKLVAHKTQRELVPRHQRNMQARKEATRQRGLGTRQRGKRGEEGGVFG